MSSIPNPILPFVAPVTADAAPTLAVPIRAYLGHLALKLDLKELSPDHFANVSRALTQFGAAWRVAYPDGRQAMIRAKLAADADAALALAGKTLGRATGAPVVVRNWDWPLAQASSDDLKRWLLANEQWKTGWTKTNNLVALVACCHWYEEETGVRAVYRRSRMPQIEKASRREADAREYIALMKHTSSVQLRRALWCLWNVQGIRTCEMRELLWTDFRWEESCIVLDKHKARRKTGKQKIVGLTPRQLRFFRGLERQKLPGTVHVFLNCEGTPWDRHTFARHLRRTAERIGLDAGVVNRMSAYCLRHTFATECDEAGVDQQKTALLLGHAGPDMLRRVYSKIGAKAAPIVEAAVEAEKARRNKRRATRKAKPKEAPPPNPDQLQLFAVELFDE